MLKILQIGLGPNPGGIENCIMNYYRNIDRDLFQFDFVDIYGQGLAYQEEMAFLGSKIFVLPNYKKYMFNNFTALKNIFKEHSYDIIHINVLSAANVIPILTSKIYSGAKIIVHCHNSDVPGGNLRKVLNLVNKFLFRYLADKRIACSMLAGNWMWGESFKYDSILYNAIDFNVYKPDKDLREFRRKECGFSDKDIVLGFVGRLTEQKNPLFLLDVLEKLMLNSVHYKLLVVGDGDYRSVFEKRIKAQGLNNNVYMAGVQDCTAEWYQAMDVFLLPSMFEGLPLVAIEAQAAGVKCLLSDRIGREASIVDSTVFLSIEHLDSWISIIEKLAPRSSFSLANINQEYDITFAKEKLKDIYYNTKTI